MKRKGLDCLIHWLEVIRDGGQPAIPYNLHELVRMFHNTLGTNASIETLNDLKNLEQKDDPQ